MFSKTDGVYHRACVVGCEPGNRNTMNTQELVDAISPLIKGDISTDEETLRFYSHDTSLFEMRPKLIVYPKGSDDVKHLVSFVTKQKKHNPSLSLTARSGGTDMSGGAINDSIILDFTRYCNGIGDIHEDGTIVEPGVFYRDFEKKTLKRKLLLPSYPASKNICALGGMINNNSGGEKTLSHGKTIDYVKNLSMVLSDGNEYVFQALTKDDLDGKMKQDDFEGEIYRKMYRLIEKNYDLIKNAKPDVSKNSTGYNIWDVWDCDRFDLTKLFVGAQGTLGINTKATVQLVPVKNHYGLLVIYLNDIRVLPHLISDIVKHQPESFEAFDDATLRLAIRFMPQFMKILGPMRTVEMGMQFLPNLLTFATNGIPKFTLLVEFDGKTEHEVHGKIRSLKEALSIYTIKTVSVSNEKEAENYFTIRRESFNLLRKNIKNKHTAPFIDDFIVKPENLVDFFPRLTEILNKHHIHTTLAGHMGDGNFHIIPLMDTRKKSEREKIPVVLQEVNDLVLEYKGSISAEHNDGMIRGHYLKKMYGQEMFDIFREVKHIFDPENIFNPHKKTDARLSYALAHLREWF